MSYNFSNIDRANIAWMKNDKFVSTLMQIKLAKGQMRGLNPFSLKLTYPISVIAGGNGTGKSTLLAIAACAYHNDKNGYIPTGRKNSYYTFSDFFIQADGELPPSGVQIRYQFLHSRWRGGKSGLDWQSRWKRTGGKWNNYDSRVKRNVVYFGVQRVVPHYERSTHKSYRAQFTNEALKEEHGQRICTIGSRVLGKPYSIFEKHTHSKYSLPIAQSEKIRYSGFNMGAGESAVFEILTALFEAGKGSLLIIDELELGLHEQAQIRFVHELKELCKEYHCQIICSTHSHVVLAALPPQARFFLEKSSDHTVVATGISAGYACGRLRGVAGGELDVLVEDELAETILIHGIPHELRERVTVRPIGSSSAVVRGMATRYLEGKDNCICILDGDKRGEYSKILLLFRGYTEGRVRSSEEEMICWIKRRLSYLPSKKTPEIWLIDACRRVKDKSSLANAWSVKDEQKVASWLKRALREQAHKQFFAISRESQLLEDQVVVDLVRFLLSQKPKKLKEVREKMEEGLSWC